MPIHKILDPRWQLVCDTLGCGRVYEGDHDEGKNELLEQAKECEWTVAGDDVRCPEHACSHDWQEQPGEPPVDVCSSCGAVRE